MTSEPKAPGAPAIYLYRQVDRDDPEGREHYYARIKILAEEGRKYANIELPFLKGHGNIKDVQARTIEPDGRIVNFDGKIYEKMVVKARGVKYLTRTFSLPDVQVGSIIEYRYRRDLEEGFIFDSRWLLSESLFTKRASFSLHHSTLYTIEWTWPLGLPEGTPLPKDDHNVVRLETANVPAFQTEDHMPPQDEMKYRVEFIYITSNESDPQRYWTKHGKSEYQGVEYFTNKHKAMEAAVSKIVAPDDTPQVKLQKIYARTQQIHNSSFEREKTKQELNREKIPTIETVEDVWKHNYGNRWAVNWLFLALARAAGLEATPVLLSTRDEHFFDRRLMNVHALNACVVAVKLNDHEMYLDPGTAFAPFGTLPWSETDTIGLRLDKDGGTWITIPQSRASDSRLERKATLRLTEDGSLEGTVSLTFTGLEALWRRLYEYDEDDQTRKKFLEDELKSYIPMSSDAELTNTPDWNNATPNLVADFEVKVPNWVSPAGRRTLFAIGLFGGTEKHVFEHATRVYPIYFNHPYQNLDDVTVTLPAGMQISSVPSLRTFDIKACLYSAAAKDAQDSIHVTRELTINLGSADPKYYGTIRNFFQHVRAEDEEPVVLSPTPH